MVEEAIPEPDPTRIRLHDVAEEVDAQQHRLETILLREHVRHGGNRLACDDSRDQEVRLLLPQPTLERSAKPLQVRVARKANLDDRFRERNRDDLTRIGVRHHRDHTP